MIDLSIIVERNPQGFSSRNQLSALLRDLFPKDKRECNLALIVYDCGIASKVSELKTIDSQQMKRFVIQLIDNYGLQEDFAVLGIEIWAKAYKTNIVTVGAVTQTNIIHQPPKSLPSSKEISSANGSLSDYEISQKENDYIISKFLGFEKKYTVIPNTIDGKHIVGIGKEAFRNCNEIEFLKISEGIELIEDGAFADCAKLRTIHFPNTLKQIGSNNYSVIAGAFANCNVESIDLPNNLEYIGKKTFASCKKLKKVSLPYNLKSIGDMAFTHCEMLNDITFPATLNEIGSYAFSDCNSIKTVIMNEGLIKIGFAAFQDCLNLKIVLISSSVSEIIDASHDIFWKFKKNNKIETIYCYAGTYGLEYARKHGYPVKNAKDFII